MSDNSPLRFSEALAYVTCTVVSTAMIWYSLIELSYCNNCTEIPFIFFFLTAFCMIIAYSTIKPFKGLFLAREGISAIQD
jgi:hypothetical protein